MTTAETPAVPKHPAKFSAPVLDAIRRVLTEHSPNHGLRIIDGCAGVGGIHDLHAQGGHDTVGVELHPAWAAQHPRNVVGDSTALPEEWTDEFDAWVTSFTYGNRMADHHDAKERCTLCDGDGCEEGCGNCQMANAGPDSHRVCTRCGGQGRNTYVRNSYAFHLRAAGHEPVGGDSDTTLMQWGKQYRDTHVAMIREGSRVVKPGGLAVINVSNHIRGHVEVNVLEWFLHAFIAHGWYVWEVQRVNTRRLGHGANRDARAPGEVLLIMHNGTPRLEWA